MEVNDVYNKTSNFNNVKNSIFTQIEANSIKLEETNRKLEETNTKLEETDKANNHKLEKIDRRLDEIMLAIFQLRNELKPYPESNCHINTSYQPSGDWN